MTNEELKMLQALPLDVKILKSKTRIQEWYNYWGGEVYISFSGGKDSTVLKHLVESIYPDVTSVFCDTGLEYPEIKKFVKSQKNVEIIKPSMPFNQVIKNYGYPVVSKEVSQKIEAVRRNPNCSYSERFKENNAHSLKYSKLYDYSRYAYLLDAPFKISHKCCDVMKKKPFKLYEKATNKKGYVGTMTIESQLRKSAYLKHGCNAFNSIRPLSAPLSFWNEQDILEYILKFNLQYASIYGEIKKDESGKYYTTGANRTGCMFCMFGINQDGKINRFQRMEFEHPNIYEYCIKPTEQGGLGIADVIDYINTSPAKRFKKIKYKND